MKLRILGSTNQQQRKHIRDLARYVIEDQVRPGIARNLSITIRLKSADMDGTVGLCWPTRENHCPRHFEINLYTRLNKRSLLETLIHELIHVRQFAHNELKFFKTQGVNRWQDTLIGEETEYWNEPWEVEARFYESKLFEIWAEERDLTNKKWARINEN